MRPACILIAATLIAGATALDAQWAPPTPVVSVTSAASDFDPCLSPDGRVLYFASTRATTFQSQLYVATRAARYGRFSAPVRLNELTSRGSDSGPAIRSDGLELFFSSDRPGGVGILDIWRATRASTLVPFSPPTLVRELSTRDVEATPSLTGDGLTIFFLRTSMPWVANIYTATRPTTSAPFGTPQPVTELNTAHYERDAHVSADGLSIVWSSDTPGGASVFNLYHASRDRVGLPFKNITRLAALSSTASDVSPALTDREDELFFATDRTTPGGGVFKLYASRFTGITARGPASPGRATPIHFTAPASPGLPYLAAAAYGSAPGIPIGTRVIPLNPDPLFALSAGGFPPIWTGYTGVLDANGTAGGTLTPPNLPALRGLRFVQAFITLHATAPSGVRTIAGPAMTVLQ